jgi:hypothetical protein
MFAEYINSSAVPTHLSIFKVCISISRDCVYVQSCCFDVFFFFAYIIYTFRLIYSFLLISSFFYFLFSFVSSRIEVPSPSWRTNVVNVIKKKIPFYHRHFFFFFFCFFFNMIFVFILKKRAYVQCFVWAGLCVCVCECV